MMLVRLQLDACQPACTYYWCMCWCSSSVYNTASYKVITTPFSTQIRQWVLCVYSNEASNMGGVLWNSINVRFIILLPSMFNYISKQNPYHEMKKMGINGFQKFVVCDINNHCIQNSSGFTAIGAYLILQLKSSIWRSLLLNVQLKSSSYIWHMYKYYYFIDFQLAFYDICTTTPSYSQQPHAMQFYTRNLCYFTSNAGIFETST